MKTFIKIFILFVIIISSFVLSSCGDEPNTYFVKYEVQTSSIYSYSNVTIEITTENGIETKQVKRNWDGTFGPISKNTPIILKVTHEGDDYVLSHSKFTGRISVSKDNSPFVLKAEETANGKPLNMSYSIDF